MAKKLTDLTIHATKDYDMFGTIVGNRPLVMGHVNRLIQKITENNLLHLNPIIVDSEVRVIDGQHRLAAARANDWTIYYVVDEGGDLGQGLKTVQDLNIYKIKWSMQNFLDSYIEQGFEQYGTIKQYMEEYHMTLGNILFLTGVLGGDRWTEFKNGTFQVRDEESVREVLDAISKLRTFTTPRVFNDRDFIRSVKELLMKLSVEELIVRLDIYGREIEHKSSKRDYLRQFEEIINFRQSGRNFIRLFE